MGDSGFAIDGVEVFDARFFATEMLSRATSVTGAALEAPDIDQAPGYQLYERKRELVYTTASL